MYPIDKPALSHALINATRSERAALNFIPEFDNTPWDRLDFYG